MVGTVALQQPIRRARDHLGGHLGLRHCVGPKQFGGYQAKEHFILSPALFLICLTAHKKGRISALFCVCDLTATNAKANIRGREWHFEYP